MVHFPSLLLPLVAATASVAAAFVPSLHRLYARSPSRTPLLKMGADEFAFKVTSAAAKYSGGPVTVDLNVYNLNLEEASNEWSATLVQNSNAMLDGVYLEAKSNALVYVDTVVESIVRKSGEGLGIELLELAGGRADGVGITIVSGLVEGSVSENSGLVPGDSIIQMSVVKGSLEDEIATIKTECTDWETIVGKIGSLPPPSGDDEKLLVTVRRLRRKPTVTVNVQQGDGGSTKKLQVLAGQNLRRAMLNEGVQLNDKYAKSFISGKDKFGDCGSTGGCGLCKIAVTEGVEFLNEPDDNEKSFVKGDKQRLSCRTIVGYGMKEGSVSVQLVDPDN
uniref:2Fe-2S ferredoxin-type domain-containing protein n=1 Tax=Odontella aurita TaxID=265563 RepID=A0A7S4K1E5_9STRA|mmetsp:Transcript_59408/g.176347  ORF Transcript_59408/g.176347 Transcript_59408/m.176347 type:complete len:335 (+) Transcript_59408:283-1287(+)